MNPWPRVEHDLVTQLVAGVLYGAVTQHLDAYTDEFTNAMRQMHWCLHGLCTTFTRCDGRVDAKYMREDFRAHYCPVVSERIVHPDYKSTTDGRGNLLIWRRGSIAYGEGI